jgi:two-component sensor histidine kinase
MDDSNITGKTRTRGSQPWHLRQLIWKEQPSFSINTILLAAIGILILPLIAFGVFQIMTLEEDARDEIRRDMRQFANATRANVDRQLSNYTAILETLAVSRAIDSDDFRELHAQSQAALGKISAHALMRDLSGQQLFNTRVDFGTELPAEKSFDMQQLENRRVYISDLLIGAVAQEPVVGINVPVIRNDRLEYVITLSLMPAIFSPALEVVNLPDDWWIELVDGRGARIAGLRNEGSIDLSMEPVYAINLPDEVVSLSSEEESPNTKFARSSFLSDWSVVVSAPESQITDQAQEAAFSFSIVWLLVAVSAVLIAFLMSRLISVSTRTLARMAHRLGEGHEVSFKPTLLKEANIVGAAMLRAADKQRQHEDELLLVMGEMKHRSKNLMAVVSSMAHQTEGSSPEECKQKIVDRLAGLSASLDALTLNDWAAADLRQLVERQLSVFVDPASPRIKIEGSPVFISLSAAQSLGMALHELGTNAIKYGALSTGDGELTVRWSVSDGCSKLFAMEWIEENGPPPRPPKKTGFGQQLIGEVLEAGLSANVKLNYPESGFVWRMTVELSAIEAPPK